MGLDTQHTDGSKRYLWVSARSDYNETKYRADVDHALDGVRSEIREANEGRQKWINDAMKEVRTLTQATEQTQKEIEDIKLAVISIYERLEPRDGGVDNGCELPVPGLRP